MSSFASKTERLVVAKALGEEHSHTAMPERQGILPRLAVPMGNAQPEVIVCPIFFE